MEQDLIESRSYVEPRDCSPDFFYGLYMACTFIYLFFSEKGQPEVISDRLILYPTDTFKTFLFLLTCCSMSINQMFVEYLRTTLFRASRYELWENEWQRMADFVYPISDMTYWRSYTRENHNPFQSHLDLRLDVDVQNS